jgi:hypothetical protein
LPPKEDDELAVYHDAQASRVQARISKRSNNVATVERMEGLEDFLQDISSDMERPIQGHRSILSPEIVDRGLTAASKPPPRIGPPYPNLKEAAAPPQRSVVQDTPSSLPMNSNDVLQPRINARPMRDQNNAPAKAIRPLDAPRLASPPRPRSPQVITAVPLPQPSGNATAPVVPTSNPPYRPPPRFGIDDGDRQKAQQTTPLIQTVPAQSRAVPLPVVAADEEGAWSKEAFELFDWRPPRLCAPSG